jgi:alkyl hydroperoxide reductase subunit AhpC
MSRAPQVITMHTLHSGRTTRFGGTMTLRFGDVTPDFTAQTTHGPIRFHEWKADKWALLFSQPRSFSFLGVSELDTVVALVSELDDRNTKVIGLSSDRVDTRRRSTSNIEDETGRLVTFPMLDDHDQRIAELYGMIHPNGHATAAAHSAVVIGPDNRLRLTMTYPASITRNFVELLRAIDCLQLAAT